MEKKPLIILTGPTAVGKTDTSIQLAKAVNGEIISADSIQVYRYMDIGSAKITDEEKEGIPHYLIDELDPDEEFHVVIFQKKARAYMEEIYARGHIPIITGGTGFYIQSILYGIDFDETDTDTVYRDYLEKLANEHGNEYLHQMLSKVDIKSAQAIHANNRKRIIRALEFHKQTGYCISEHNEIQKKKESIYQFVYFVLNRNREELYQRINRRVDIMFEQGLVKEVQTLLSMGYERKLVSMQGLGYKEVCSYLAGEITQKEAIEIIKRDTRHFAKRQLTWFKREEEVTWISMEDYENNSSLICELLAILKEHGVKKGMGKDT